MMTREVLVFAIFGRLRALATSPLFFGILYLGAIPAFAITYAGMWRDLRESVGPSDAAVTLLRLELWARLAQERVIWLPSVPAPSQQRVLIVHGRKPLVQDIEGYLCKVGGLEIEMHPTPMADFQVEDGAITFRQEILVRAAEADPASSVRYWISWRVYPRERNATATIQHALDEMGIGRSTTTDAQQQDPHAWVDFELRGIPNFIALAVPRDSEDKRTINTERVVGRIFTPGESVTSSGPPPSAIDPKGTDADMQGLWKIARPTLAALIDYADVLGGRPVPAQFGFGRYLYLSVVTITTLGFGDMVPATDRARFVVGLEAVTGVILAGLFLNAIAMRLAAQAAATSTNRQDSHARHTNTKTRQQNTSK